MAFAQLRGQNFRYDDSGGTGPALVLSHGILMDGTMFQPQIDEFGTEYRVITWDHRGFGETTTDGEPFTIWDQVDDLLALCDYLGVDQAVFGGMSHGGYITMRMPMVAPERVLGIITMNTNSLGLPPEEQVGYRNLFDAWMNPAPSEELCATFAGIAIGDPAQNEVWTRKWLAGPPERGMRHSIDVTVGIEDITPRLAEVSCPALVIHGKDDPAFDVSKAENIAQNIPNATGPVFVPGGHAACMTHPEEVNQAIREFLVSLK